MSATLKKTQLTLAVRLQAPNPRDDSRGKHKVSARNVTLLALQDFLSTSGAIY